VTATDGPRLQESRRPSAGTGAASPLLDVGQAAAHLGVTEPFIRRLVLERRVRYYKVGKYVRFHARDLDAFVEAGRREPMEVRVPLPRRARSVTTRAPAGPENAR